MQRRQVVLFAVFVAQGVDAALCRHRHLVENGPSQPKHPRTNKTLRSLAP